MWPVLEVGRSITALGTSEHISINGISDFFNVNAPEKWEIRAEISTSEETDYNLGNNTYVKQIQIDPHERDPICDKPGGGPNWDLSGVGGGGCFIATAGYGSKWHPHVQTLRDFRDHVLMQSAWGREMVKFYYRHSPKIALYISRHESMRTVTRWLLTPVVYAVTYPFTALAVLISLGFLISAAWKRLY
jgi:hypothetical protein